MSEPAPGQLEAERRRIDRIVRRLHETADPAERADLGSELVRAVSRYEDTLERAVLPHFERLGDPHDVERDRRDRRELRDAMTVVHDRTSHIDPRNVHVSDPEGFERALGDVLVRVEQHLGDEDGRVSWVLGRMPDDERARILEAVARAAGSASERPHPPRTSIGRAVSNAQVKLDHTIEDVATPHHPGAPVVDAGED